MARRKDSPQKAAMREMMRDYLKNNDISIKDGTDVNSIMRDMMSVLLEGALDEELDEELGYSKYDYRNKETDNSRNGHSSKTMHTSYGDMDVAIPRDRNGDYEPQLIKKYQNTVTQDMEEKILSMYAKGMTTGDIESHMRELYDIDISDSTISRITDKILPIVKEWQERPLEEVYAVVFMDAIHYHVRSEGRIVKRAVYIALGIDMNGKKDVLGMYVGENESAKFWLSIMNGLKNRGVEDILIACVDGLNGFPQAIEAVYPKTEIQQCIIHQIRNSTKFAIAIVIHVIWINAPRWLYTVVYIIFGIYGLAYMVMFWNSPYAGPAVVVLLCAGGACYILGAIVYALRKPDPWPRVFGFHEIFHCGTVAGYACHMVAIYMVIVSLWQ